MVGNIKMFILSEIANKWKIVINKCYHQTILKTQLRKYVNVRYLRHSEKLFFVLCSIQYSQIFLFQL